MDLIFTCYAKDNQQGCSGLATDSPRGVWGRGWTACLLHDSPLFGSHFKMRVGMYVLEWDFIYVLLVLVPVHGFMHETSDFLLYNNLFIYQILCTLIYRRRSLLLFLIGGFYSKDKSGSHVCISNVVKMQSSEIIMYMFRRFFASLW